MCIDYFSLFIFQAVGFCGENTLSLEIFRSNLVVKDHLIWLIVLILSYIHVLPEAKEMRIKFKYACEIALYVQTGLSGCTSTLSHPLGVSVSTIRLLVLTDGKLPQQTGRLHPYSPRPLGPLRATHSSSLQHKHTIPTPLLSLALRCYMFSFLI